MNLQHQNVVVVHVRPERTSAAEAGVGVGPHRSLQPTFQHGVQGRDALPIAVNAVDNDTNALAAQIL